MTVRAAVILGAVLCFARASAADDQKKGDWHAPAAAPTHVQAGPLVRVVDVSPPGTIAVQANTPYTSMAGDDDGFGFGYGWIPPLICDVFGNEGPEDLGVFDQRRPNVCSKVGTWTQSVPVPPGGIGALTVAIRILGGEGDPSQCFANPCGCATPSPQLLINGIPQPGFFSDPGCAQIILWTESFFAVGLDQGGAKIGPIKCSWAANASGSPAAQGGGSVTPTDPASSTTFTPSKPGKITLEANPSISGVQTKKTDLFVTKLYVEVDAFNPTSPVDQLPRFVPGSRTDGSSVDLQIGPQHVTLHVLTGQSSRGSVTFQLSKVSAYPGIAMNFPLSNPQTDPDMYFSGGSPTSTVTFSGTGDTTGDLSVNDYAANAKLDVSITSGKTTYHLKQISLPIDDNGNMIPDAGWMAEDATIPDFGNSPGTDEDNSPPMNLALPNFSDGIGDALTNFEEYRGFIFFGSHRRTNPFHKDYFIEAQPFNDDISYAYPALPTSTYRVSHSDYSSTFSDPGYLLVNPNWQGLPGAASHQNQRVVHVLDLGFSSAGLGGETVCAEGPLPHVPLLCAEIHIFTQNIAAVFPTDPASQVELRRAVVAHEAGHSVNLFHDNTAGCLMYGGKLTSAGFIPTEFCLGIDTTLDCTTCTPAQAIPVTNFNETDTLRVKF